MTVCFDKLIYLLEALPCSKTVYLGEGTGLYSGSLNYTTKPMTTVSCLMTLQPDNDSVINYNLHKVSMQPPLCFGSRCGCRNSLTIKSSHLGQTDVNTYCSQSSIDTRDYVRTLGKYVEFNVKVGVENYTVYVVIFFLNGSFLPVVNWACSNIDGDMGRPPSFAESVQA